MNTISLDDFIMSVRNGHEGPNIPCIRRNMRGDQVFELPFRTVCNGYCKKHDVHPLSLYTIIQQGICDDMTRRTQRSSLFRNLLDNVKDDWGYNDLYLPDIFVVKNVDFDESHMKNEEDYLETVKSSLNNFNSSLEGNDNDQDVYDNILSLRSDIGDCIERNSNHIINLSNEIGSPYSNLWNDLSTVMKSDYLQSLQDPSDDTNVLRYATKKINKEIPDETPQMFTNLSLLEVLKLKKIEEYKRKITSIIRELQEMKNGLDELLRSIPKPEPEPSSNQSWLSYLMGGDVSSDEEVGTDDELGETERELQGAINEFSYEPTDTNEDDLKVEETDSNVEGIENDEGIANDDDDDNIETNEDENMETNEDDNMETNEYDYL